MQQLLIELADGFVVGATLALIALGLTLIFGVMHIVNLAHGEFYMAGAYFTWALDHLFHNFWLGVAAASVATAVLGWSLLMGFYPKLAGAGPLRWALLTLGFAFVLREAARLTFGSDFKLVELPLKGNVFWLGGEYRLVVAGLSVALIVAVFIFLNKSRYGILIRSVASNMEAAAVVGVSATRIYGLVAFVSAGLAGIAGGLMLPITSAYPTMGIEILIMAFVVVVVGGMGNIRGALWTSLIAGEAQALLTIIMPPNVAFLLVLFTFMAVLVVRREGVARE